LFFCGFPIPLVFYSPFIGSQWGDGHGSIGLLQALFSKAAGQVAPSKETTSLAPFVKIPRRGRNERKHFFV